MNAVEVHSLTGTCVTADETSRHHAGQPFEYSAEEEQTQMTGELHHPVFGGVVGAAEPLGSQTRLPQELTAEAEAAESSSAE